MQWWEYAQLWGIVALASLCQNLTGFAFALIFVGVVGALDVLPIAEAANVAGILSLVNGVVYLRHHPVQPRWDVLKPLASGTVLGVVGGLVLLHWLSGHAMQVLRVLLGLAIIGCAVVLLLQKVAQRQPSGRCATWMAGISAGVLSGLFSTAGPPLVYHLYRQPLPGGVVRQCLVLLFLLSGTLRLGVVLALGELSWHAVLVSAVAVPVVALVTWAVAKHPPPLPQRLLQWLVCGLLVLAGVSLLLSGR